MNKKLREELQEITSKHIGLWAEALNRLPNLTSKLHVGTWSNDRGIIMAYLSSVPIHDPARDNIEATIELTLSDMIVLVTVTICFSSGEIIYEIAEQELSFITLPELLSKVNQLLESLEQEILSRLSSLILKHNESENSLL